MKVILDKDYPMAPEGHTTTLYKAGTELEGKAAEIAIKVGVARRPKKSTPKPDVAKTPKPDHEG